MDKIFFDAVKRIIVATELTRDYKINLSKSMLMDGFQDQIIELDSDAIRLAVVLDKTQVQLLVGPLDSNDWFDLSSLAYFLSSGVDDWAFEYPKTPPDLQLTEQQLNNLIVVFRKYETKIYELFKRDSEYTLRKQELQETMNRRWEKRQKLLKQKMRFPFFNR